jgi:hypothetical protein
MTLALKTRQPGSFFTTATVTVPALDTRALSDPRAHVQLEGELRYREYEEDYGTKKAPAPKHRVAEIHVNRILKLDRAEKQDEPAPEVDPSELPADEPTA